MGSGSHLDAAALGGRPFRVDAGWKDAKLALLEDAKKPSGMVKFDFLPALQKLVEAAAAPAQ